MQKTVAAGRFWHRRKHSIDIDSVVLEQEFAQSTAPSTDDVNIQSSSNTEPSPTSMPDVQTAAQIEQNAKEKWAAIQIQTAFRAFLVCIHFPPLFSVSIYLKYVIRSLI